MPYVAPHGHMWDMREKRTRGMPPGGPMPVSHVGAEIGGREQEIPRKRHFCQERLKRINEAGGGGTLVVSGSHRLLNDCGAMSSKSIKRTKFHIFISVQIRTTVHHALFNFRLQ